MRALSIEDDIYRSGMSYLLYPTHQSTAMRCPATDPVEYCADYPAAYEALVFSPHQTHGTLRYSVHPTSPRPARPHTTYDSRTIRPIHQHLRLSAHRCTDYSSAFSPIIQNRRQRYMEKRSIKYETAATASCRVNVRIDGRLHIDSSQLSLDTAQEMRV